MISRELEEFIKDETKAFEERLRAKAEELQEQIPDKPKTIWDLRKVDGEKYYYLSLDGIIGESCFNSRCDESIRALGNAFLAKEKAEFEKERRKVETIMRRYARPFVEGEDNWIIEYQYQDKEIYAYCYNSYYAGVPSFESEEIAQKVIDEIGEYRLLKYWFGVKDE